MTSLPYPVPTARVSEDAAGVSRDAARVPEDAMRVPEDDSLTVRLRGLSAQQLLEAMTFLAWWSSAAFTATLDYCEAGDWGADDFDPDLLPDPDHGGGGAAEPTPVCGRCGGDLGIFLRFGLDWRHYTGTGLDDIELYDPGHAPEVTWRSPAPAAAPTAA